MKPLRRLRCCCILVALTPALAAQSRSAQLLAAAREHIAARQWDSADAALSEALESAPYIMDSSWTYVWRGVLEYQRGHGQLARVSFRRALALYPDPGVRGLDTISPGLASVFDREFRAIRIFHAGDLDQPARRLAGPTLIYPPELRRRRVAGDALVRMIVDTLGRVDENDIEILATPDSAFIQPLKQMMTAAAFSPARIAGKPVRSIVAYHFKLTPPAPRDPVRVIDLARTQLRANRPDSALALLQEALDPAAGATPAIRVYAELVRGIAWHLKRDARAAAALDTALSHYQELRARGVEFAPFLRSLADSIRLTARRE
ncbi:MAG TPA: energy transducer TonB [Gemmatimonadales bacterium]|jgi:TonB family protein|nr:energy transducer TonB [Gemmatimonadales bacterium]